MTQQAGGQQAIRRASAADRTAVLELYGQARRWFAANAIDQWQDGYPDTCLDADLAKGQCYVILKQGAVAAVFMAAMGPDASYETAPSGLWHTNGPYAVLHRVAVDGRWKGCGLAGSAVEYACALYPQAAALRGDTHADNRSMQRMFLKNGFVRCGDIMLADGAPRVAFEKPLGAMPCTGGAR